MNAIIKVKKHRVEFRERPETSEKDDYSDITRCIVIYQYIDTTILISDMLAGDE